MAKSFALKIIIFIFCVVTMTLNSVVYAKIHKVKVDNFVFLYDASSSMGEGYKYEVVKKGELCLEAMHDINNNIPKHDFQSGLFTIVPDFRAHQSMSIYNKKDFEESISSLPASKKYIGPQTPLAEGLTHLDNILDDLSGKTALILFSDGGENKGGNTEKVLKQIYQNYDACLHFVSYAHKDKEKKLIEKLKAINDCSEMISGNSVQDSYSRNEFVRKIFYTTKRITLDVKFDFDKTEIKPKFHDELKEIGLFLKHYPEANITLEGHTDSIGTKEYNQDLSERRASSVKEYIVNKFDISSDRITAKGYGESKPIADNDTPAGRQKNRRVEGIFPEEFQKK